MRRRRRWDRNQYPANWEEISQSFRASRNYTCEHCGTARGTLRVSRAGRPYPSKAVAAHRYPNDTSNPQPELLCLCERCHFAYDARFREMLEEGEHQVVLHEILVDRWQGQNDEEQDEPVCCSCGMQDARVQFGCGNCGRPVHYQEPECGGWLTEQEFWCLECLAENEVNTFFRCAVHPSTTVSVRGNSYYCRVCGCTPEQIIGPYGLP